VVSVRVTRRGHPVEGASVTVGGARVRTRANGAAKLRPALDVPGSYAALARSGRLQGRSKFLALGPQPAAAARTSSVPLR
jgi:hypothetical protein